MTNDLREYRSGRSESEDEAGDGTRPSSPAQGPASPAEEPAPASAGWSGHTTLDDARRAYVKKNYHRFQGLFESCDEAGGLKASLALAPFFFGYLWFFYRKMYLEGFLLMVAGFTISGSGNALLFTNPAAGLTLYAVGGLGLLLFMTVFGKAVYWKAVDRQIEKAMRLHPRDPDRALAWLRSAGGVNIWIVAAIIALAVIAMLLGLALLGLLMELGGVDDLEGLRRMLEENSLNI